MKYTIKTAHWLVPSEARAFDGWLELAGFMKVNDTPAAGRKGTPNNVINKLNAAAVYAMADPLVRARLADLGLQFPPREEQTPASGSRPGADSGPSRTVIPAHCGQRSGDCGQFLMSDERLDSTPVDIRISRSAVPVKNRGCRGRFVLAV
jgi:hypothetical protein